MEGKSEEAETRTGGILGGPSRQEDRQLTSTARRTETWEQSRNKHSSCDTKHIHWFSGEPNYHCEVSAAVCAGLNPPPPNHLGWDAGVMVMTQPEGVAAGASNAFLRHRATDHDVIDVFVLLGYFSLGLQAGSWTSHVTVLCRVYSFSFPHLPDIASYSVSTP